MDELERLREEGREEVLQRMLSKGVKLTLEEIADLCDIELWRAREIKDNYRRNKVHIVYARMTKDAEKKGRDTAISEYLFDLMKFREKGGRTGSDAEVMNTLGINEKELAEFKLRYLIDKNKKKSAEERMKEIVEKIKRDRGIKYILVRIQLDEGMTLEEALEMYNMTKGEFDYFDCRLPKLVEIEDKQNNLIQSFVGLVKKGLQKEEN